MNLLACEVFYGNILSSEFMYINNIVLFGIVPCDLKTSIIQILVLWVAVFHLHSVLCFDW